MISSTSNNSSLSKQIATLLVKEIRMEWRNKYALMSIILLLITSVFIAYTIDKVATDKVWHGFFYLILIFGLVQNITRSFLFEQKGVHLYYKFLCDNRAVIISKLLYQFLINLLFLVVLFVLMNFLLKQSILHLQEYMVTAVLFTLCNAAIFTFNSSIALGAKNSGLIASVLSFPLLIPNLMVSLQAAEKSMIIVENVNFLQDWLILGLLIIISILLATVLFKNIWLE